MKTMVAAIVAFLMIPLAGMPEPPVARPKLVVVLSIDQMRFDYLTRFRPLYKGGFRTLLENGAVFTNANYRHANTETGPGHSVILTGRHGSHSGIIANGWYDTYLKKFVNVVDDPMQTPVGGQGRAASPVNMIGPTVGDALKRAFPGTHVVGISLKDRAAILMAGHLADGAYWFETAEGRFITSSYYAKSTPGWLTTWNAKHYADRFAGTAWDRLNPDVKLYEKYAGADAVEGESDRILTTFPHLLAEKPPDPKFYSGFRFSPFADEMILDAAVEAMKGHQMGLDDTTDILAIGFSATDFIGHTYGPDSQEIMDQMLRLDRTLERLFREVDARAGLVNTLFILTADHGVLPLVELLNKQHPEARRVPTTVLEDSARKALGSRFPGITDLIAEYDPPHFYLNEESIRSHKLNRTDVEKTIADALMTTGIVQRVYTQGDFTHDGAANDPDFVFFRNSFFAPRSPHLIVALKQYIYLEDYPGGTGHGTQYGYDRHVPIIFMGRGITPGMYADPCGPEDIAPTLAKILSIDFPKEEDARILQEVLVSANSRK